MKTIANLIMTLTVVCVLAACNKTEVIEPAPDNNNGQHRSTLDGAVSNNSYSPLSKLGSTKLYYQNKQHTLFLKSVANAPSPGAVSSTNQLFVYGPLPENFTLGKSFYPIARQIITEGNSIVLEAVLIRFNPGNTPRQFYSAAEVYDAARGPRPIINIVNTGVYFSASNFSSNRQATGGSASIQ